MAEPVEIVDAEEEYGTHIGDILFTYEENYREQHVAEKSCDLVGKLVVGGIVVAGNLLQLVVNVVLVAQQLIIGHLQQQVVQS